MTDGPPSAVDPIMAEALDWVLKLNEKPGDPRVEAELRKWLATAEAHAKAYRKAQQVWRLTGDVPPTYSERWAVRTPGGHHAPGVSRFGVTGRRSTAGARRRSTLGRKRWLYLAGVACAASLAALLLLDARTLIEADYRTGAGQVRNVTLPDGSAVTLGGSSALAVKYGPSQRRVVLLDGQAFFNVIHDAGRPFMVEAVGATAHDIGTAFDINIAPENVVVAVQSGTVGVFFGTAPAETLTAGERLTIDRATWHSVRTRKPIDSIAAWRAGRLVVDNLPVGEVVQYLRRYYNGYIWVHDPALNNRRISGVYNLNDPVSALRAVVEPHAGVVTTITPFLLVVTTR